MLELFKLSCYSHMPLYFCLIIVGYAYVKLLTVSSEPAGSHCILIELITGSLRPGSQYDVR